MTSSANHERGRANIVVVAVGASAPLGSTALGVVTAARADLLGVSECWLEDRHGDRIGVARSGALADDCHGPARLCELAAPALREAAGNGGAARPLVLAMPGPGRPDDDPRATDAILAEIARASEAAVDLGASSVVRGGHAGFALALARALELIDRGAPEVLVGGVDSYFHPAVLAALDDARRLHAAQAENGFIPGEGAAFALLRRGDAGPGLARLGAVANRREDSGASGAPNVADAMTRAVREGLGPRRDPVPWTITDENTEEHRAEEWAFVRAREERIRGAINLPLPRWFGDTGAATGALALVFAAVSFDIGAAPAREVLVALHADGPERGVFTLEARS